MIKNLPSAVVVEFVEAGHGDEASTTGTERVENLDGGVAPNLEKILIILLFYLDKS